MSINFGRVSEPVAAGRAVPSPFSVGPFVGRKRELEWLRSRLGSGLRRLAVVGPPGIGKTRLVQAWLRDAGGWVHVALGSIREVARAREAVADALGIPLPDPDDEDALRRALARRPGGGLWIDGGEHLAAGWSRALSAGAPETRVLISGRRAPPEAEAILRLGPLDAEDARALFAACVRRWRPAYAPDEDDREAVDELLEHLGRNPLAIELAAAETLVVGTRALARRLAVPGRGRLASEDALRAALASGWETLDDAERTVLRRCAVFDGTFTAEGAEAVVGVLAGAGGRAVVGVLGALVAKSMIASEARAGETHLTLPAPVRDEARRRLDSSGERPGCERRHVVFHASLADRVPEAEPLVSQAIRRQLREATLDLELAARRALDAGEPEHAAAALVALEPGWWRRGPRGSGLELADRALAALPEQAARWRIRLGHARAVALRSWGALDEARAGLEDAASRAARAGEPLLEARCTSTLAFVHRSAGRHALAANLYAEAIATFEAHGAALALAQALTNLAVVEHERGRIEEARRAFEEATRHFERHGRAELGAVALAGLGRIHFDEGRLAAALQACREAAEAAERADDDWTRADNCMALGGIQQELGRFEEARASYDEALALFERADRALGGSVRAFRGMLELEAGDPTAARGWLDRAVRAGEALGDRWCVRLAHAVRAIVCAALHAPDEAARDLEATEALADVEDPALARVVWAARRWIDLRHAPTEPPPAPPSALARWADRIETRRAPMDGPGLTVHVDAHWLRTPDGRRVDLGRQPLLRRLLDRLATERAGRPGAVVPVEALVEAGWPGETIFADAARNRLRVALNRLRSKGLGALLESHAGGYRLRRDLPFRWSEDPG